ncbi:MAG: hypothetical protein H7X86_00620 [Gorillibacterium sp.]|nr:hypothetical protein [Gorillibacterium sp.]
MIWNSIIKQASAVCTEGSFEVDLKSYEMQDWQGSTLHLSGKGKVRYLRLDVCQSPSFDEMLVVDPNFEDIRYAHESQAMSQAFNSHNSDCRFNRQWFFSPPPMVFPVRMGDDWYGIALGAEAGNHMYSSWTYRPVSKGHFQLDVFYDGYYTKETEACTVFFGTKAYSDPYQVIAAYSILLRELKWAPTVEREPALWWKDTFLCTWGEQWNTAEKFKARPFKQLESHQVTTYETQANQVRWIKGLVNKGVPIGVVSTSDKWQEDRYRLVPDEDRYDDMRGFADWNHSEGRHVIAWFGLWSCEGAPLNWCILDANGKPVAIDTQNPEYRQCLQEDVKKLISPEGYDMDGFFLDFTSEFPVGMGHKMAGNLYGLEMLHDYLKLIHDAAKSVKPDAMIMTHCPHPYFADVTDVLRLNDWAFKEPNLVEQARYRAGIVRACSDWLINTDNWFMYDVEQWREYLKIQPDLGIPATWHTRGVWGMGTEQYVAFTEEDYKTWGEIWTAYRVREGLQ